MWTERILLFGSILSVLGCGPDCALVTEQAQADLLTCRTEHATSLAASGSTVAGTTRDAASKGVQTGASAQAVEVAGRLEQKLAQLEKQVAAARGGAPGAPMQHSGALATMMKEAYYLSNELQTSMMWRDAERADDKATVDAAHEAVETDHRQSGVQSRVEGGDHRALDELLPSSPGCTAARASAEPWLKSCR